MNKRRDESDCCAVKGACENVFFDVFASDSDKPSN